MPLLPQARNILIVIAALAVGGCMYDAGDQGAASKLVAELHQDMQQQNWDGAMKLYGEEFFKQQSREGWRERLVSLGQLKEARQTFSQKDPRYSGDFYIYSFKLRFEQGRADETITVFRPLDKDQLFIIGHSIKQGKHHAP